MKGKLLTLEEVLQLEDRTKVWVEEPLDSTEESGIHIVHKWEQRLYDSNDCFYDFKGGALESGRIKVYEWIKNDFPYSEDKIDTITQFKSTIYNLAEEICNLRGLDLNDDNIEMIIKEFS